MLANGTPIGPYAIVGWLGAGGMGEVYRARDPRLDRDVAIKLIPETYATDATRVHRFEQEARAAGQLNHPNILAVYDVGVQDGRPFIVSELLEGESLRSRLRDGPLPQRKAVDYARQIAEGLAAAHDKHIVHRDLKPENLFITTDGRIKILDFGLAKLTRPSDLPSSDAGARTETKAGVVLGTTDYMSPEQVRGEAVDARSDIFSAGSVCYEMLVGRPPFSRETAPETMTAVLKDEATLPSELPLALGRIVTRCLEKMPESRFQSARDLAFALDVLSQTGDAAVVGSASRRWKPPRLRTAFGVAVVALSLAAIAASWLTLRSKVSIDQLLARAKYSYFTTFDGTETDAAISPDGHFIAFLADTTGPFHVWLSRVGTERFADLTPNEDDQGNRQAKPIGFSPDGSEIWICGTPFGRRLRIMPLLGGASHVFLQEHAISVSWASDGQRLAYYTTDDGDPVIVADRGGDNPRQLFVDKVGDHNHFPTWSTDDQWIYYVHFTDEATAADLWRVPAAGGVRERLTRHNSDVRFPTPIDDRTVLYVARAEDRSGPWLWALDVPRKESRRVSVGPDRYLSVAASADHRRLVATIAKSSAVLWSVPLLERIAEDRDLKPYPLRSARALAPRFGGASLFYLSSSGAADGLWRALGDQTVEIWKASDGALLDPPAVSADGSRVAVAIRAQGSAHLTVISADGAERQSLAAGVAVRGTAAWSPDGQWIVSGGTDSQGPGLFKIPAAGGEAVRLVSHQAFDPVWSPTEDLIVYAGPLAGGTAPLLATRADGTPVALPPIRTSAQGGGCVRFLPDGTGVVYLFGTGGHQGLWLLDLATKKTRQLADLPNAASTGSFDITPDGKQIVFDRLRENSDIVLIDLPD